MVVVVVVTQQSATKCYTLESEAVYCGDTTELYIQWSELSRHKLSPTLATVHYSSLYNAIRLVAQCELSGYVKLG